MRGMGGMPGGSMRGMGGTPDGPMGRGVEKGRRLSTPIVIDALASQIVTVPANARKVSIEAIQAGANGVTDSYGGKGGDYSIAENVRVRKGQKLTIVVGSSNGQHSTVSLEGIMVCRTSLPTFRGGQGGIAENTNTPLRVPGRGEGGGGFPGENANIAGGTYSGAGGGGGAAGPFGGGGGGAATYGNSNTKSGDGGASATGFAGGIGPKASRSAGGGGGGIDEIGGGPVPATSGATSSTGGKGGSGGGDGGLGYTYSGSYAPHGGGGGGGAPGGGGGSATSYASAGTPNAGKGARGQVRLTFT